MLDLRGRGSVKAEKGLAEAAVGFIFHLVIKA